jgi:porphobilinogen deaminase
MHAVVASPDGLQTIRREAAGAAADPAGIGKRLAEELARAGAMEILDGVREP